MSSGFYTNVQLMGNNILWRGVDKNGNRFSKKMPYKPTLFVPSKDKTSKFKTLRKFPVEKIEFDSIRDAKDFVQKYEDVDNFQIYGNTDFKYTFIADYYPNDITWDLDKFAIFTIDMEVGSENGFPEPSLANEEVTAMTIKYRSKYHVFGCGDYTPTRDDIIYTKCDNEADLLMQVLELWDRVKPDVLTGWNIRFFDIVYLVNRIRKVLDNESANILSPWRKIKDRNVTMMGREHVVYDLMGVAILDYIELHRKFTLTNHESYKLNHIAFVELGEEKLSYEEYGSLHSLYKRNFQLYIDYNIKDVELIHKLDEKLRLIELALTFAYDYKVNLDDVFMQVRMWDAIAFNELKHRNMVVPQKVRQSKLEAYEGAFVKEPQIGRHGWVIAPDLTSLYPKLMMQFNISPDTILDNILPNSEASVDRLLGMELDLDYLKEKNACLAPNGQHFDMTTPGFLPEILEKMFDARVIYKGKMLEAERAKEKATSEEEKSRLTKEVARYKNLQQSKKVGLNSAYGAMGNPYFRYYDVRQAEAVTKAGQMIIRWIERDVNTYMNKMIGTKGVDYIIASDTDSLYIKFQPLVDQLFPDDQSDTNKIVNTLDKIFKEMFDPMIAKSFDKLAKYVNTPNKMHMKRETISNKAIWTAKKHYILNVLDSEGTRYKEPKLKIMGLECVKSSTPAPCRDKIKAAIKIMLAGTEDEIIKFVEQFRKDFKKLPVEDVAFPRSVNGLDKYASATDVYVKGAPIHVKSVLFYNALVKQHKVTTKYPLIREGEKIKYVYLKEPNPLKNNALAISTTFPKEFGLDKYIDFDVQFEKAFLEPIKGILDVIGWKVEKTASLESFFG